MSKIFEFIDGPKNFEIIQQKNGVANIEVVGRLVEDLNDDTEQVIPYAFENIYISIINEDDGSYVSKLVPLSGSEERCCASFPNIPCGGPYAFDLIYLEADGGWDFPMRGEKRRHFYVGDVYIIAGQSNAAGMGKGFLYEPAELGIHILRNLDYWDIAIGPYNDFDYAKQSIFTSFAKKVKSVTNHPIGFIPAAIGGASVDRWVEGGNGDLYKKMMKVIRDNKIEARAVLWYQGCCEAGENKSSEEYIQKFGKFVAQIRRDMNNSDMKVFTFQLNRMMFAGRDEALMNGYSTIREAQRVIPSVIDNVYVIPTQDASIMSDFIHSNKASNVMLGERLALQVLDKEYGIGRGADAPDIADAKLIGSNSVELSFDNVFEFLYTFNETANDLPIMIEDQNGVMEISEYKVVSNKIILTTTRDVVLPAYASGQNGNDVSKIIVDYGTQIPMLGFYRFEIK